MAPNIPIILEPVADLSAMGVSNQSFRFGSLTMESERYICVKEVGENGNQVVVIDLKNNNTLTRKPMKADASLMNPKDNIMALKGKTEDQSGHFIQVFNLDTKTKLAVYEFLEPIVLWKWLSQNEMAVITEKCIYHWKIHSNENEQNSTPEKIFDRQGKLADATTQLINYAVDKQKKWCILVGISTDDQGKTIDGSMQLYSIEKKQQQMLEGHTGCFCNFAIHENKGNQGVFCFSEKKKNSTSSKLHIMDIYTPRVEGGNAPFKITSEIIYPPEIPTDFPIAMHASEKYGVLYLLTKAGYLFIFDSITGTMLYRHRISQESVFIACDSSKNSGILLVNRKGQVITASIDENTLINYIQSSTSIINNQSIAINLAKRYGLPGADELLIQQFNQLFAIGDYKSASRIVAIMKSGALRTPNTIRQFKSVQNNNDTSSPSPILQYFSTLLEYGKLNKLESIELVKPVVLQGRKEFIERWLSEDKLECSEELGDIIKQLDTHTSLSVYKKSSSPSKVIQCLVETGQYNQIVSYAKASNHTNCDYSFFLRNMIGTCSNNIEDSISFTKELLNNNPPLIDINQVIEIMLSNNRLQEVTSLLLEYLKNNKPEQAQLQTRLLEINLNNAPEVAETIFQMEIFTHYDRHKIAILCEKSCLFQRALEHYSDVLDIKRVMLHTGTNISVDWMQTYFSKLGPDVCLEILTDMLRNSRSNQQILQTIYQMSIKFNEQIGTCKLINMYESFNSWEGIFYFLGSVMVFSQDPEVHYKYIEAASKLNHISEVERVCRESQVYDPVKVKEFLKHAQLPDPRPLIYVWDLHGYVCELSEYLYKNNLLKYIEVYVIKVNPSNCPLVIGTLIDLDCCEEYIKTLLLNVRSSCPVKPLVDEVEKRNRLLILLEWLESRVNEGNHEPELHNALAKIFIDTNKDSENFLRNNLYYDSKIVGQYCEDRDPHLAYTAYKRGQCDEELVNVTNKNGLFRLQARYLVERQSIELWQNVLNKENEFKRSVVDQIVLSALPDATNAEEVSTTVKAFIAADLPNELIELLEKIVLHNSDFCNNKNLQNLLILTAVKADKTRVIDYINKLDNYDGPEIASVAIQYKLYDEAFIIYKKFNLNKEAIETLLNDDNLERAINFASTCNQPDVWSRLGKKLLESNKTTEAIDSFLKSQDPSFYKEVIEKTSTHTKCYEDLCNYLEMARKKPAIKDQLIDTELLYSYGKTRRINDMEEFLMSTNTANVQLIGNRLFDEELYDVAKILFTSIPNNSKLALCYLKLSNFSQAIEAAKKAKNPSIWKQVNIHCLESFEIKSAHIAGLSLIVHPDHLEGLIREYENRGLLEELIYLLESGVNEEIACHVGLYTELAIIYAKYKSEKLLDFCRTIPQNTGQNHKNHNNSITIASSKLNIPRVIKTCEENYLWKECVFLHISYDEYDQAINIMINHSPSSWSHEQFMTVIQNVSNSELYYRSLSFYLENFPLQLNSLLKTIEKKLDHGRVVQQMKKSGHLSLLLPYLQSVKSNNNPSVNEALCDLYTESEDYAALLDLLTEYDNFDQMSLAVKLENHELKEMRRVSYILYRKNKKFKKSLDLSNKDGNYNDSMEIVRDSGSSILVEELLAFFIKIQDKERFCACLFICFHLVKPDVALELAWVNGYMDQAMPFLIQVMREYTSRINTLDKKEDLRQTEQEKLKSAPNDYSPEYIIGPGHPIGGVGSMGNLAIMPPPGGNMAGGMVGGMGTNMARGIGTNMAGGMGTNMAGGMGTNMAGGMGLNMAGGMGTNMAGGMGTNIGTPNMVANAIGINQNMGGNLMGANMGINGSNMGLNATNMASNMHSPFPSIPTTNFKPL